MRARQGKEVCCVPSPRFTRGTDKLCAVTRGSRLPAPHLPEGPAQADELLKPARPLVFLMREADVLPLA